MSNLAKDWQEGKYSVRVSGKTVTVSTMQFDKGSYLGDRKIIATAKCAPEDEFSLSIGVALAIDRLNKQLESANKEIKVGDRVQIVSPDKAYTIFTNWVTRYVHDGTMVAMYKYNCVPSNGIVGKVIAVAPHNIDKRKMLLYIEQSHPYGITHPGCWLMDFEGVKKL